ncbi:MAG: hypothetical protein J0M08_12995 [Bacteroidetes bacterium]|nr:hypothetical protein [Bacteroidota bacterium]
MNTYKLLLLLSFLLTLGSCDPVHSIKLENKTKDKIDLFYNHSGDIEITSPLEIKTVEIKGEKWNKLTLDSNQYIYIGQIIANYTPEPTDLTIEKLIVVFGSDTIYLRGKNAIYSTLYRADKLDWRLTIKK